MQTKNWVSQYLTAGIKLRALAIGMFLLPSLAMGVGQAQALEEDVTMSGWVSVIIVDPEPGSKHQDPKIKYLLTDEKGQSADLIISAGLLKSVGGMQSLQQRKIKMRGKKSEKHGQITVSHIEVTAFGDAGGVAATTSLGATGSTPWATILCRFSDIPDTPHEVSWFNTLMGNSYPGMDHFFRENSYNQMNLEGSQVYGWYNLPSPQMSYFFFDANGQVTAVNTIKLLSDCAAAADADAYFPNFMGINFMFNAGAGGAYQTRLSFDFDGQVRQYPVTSTSQWGYENQYVMAQEMGHAYGLPHSSGAYGQTYDSDWDPMSNGGACVIKHPQYGCLGDHTISYHKDRLGWIPPGRKYIALPGSSTTLHIERLAQPVSATDYLMAQIPFGTTGGQFYTVEARRNVGYDMEIPGEAIIIHNVDTRRGDRLAQVVDSDTTNNNPNDAGAMWTVGETFTDPVRGISVAVQNMTSTGYDVTISNNPLPAPDLLVSSVTAPPTAATGSSISIPVQVKNQGSGSTEQGFRVAVNYAYYHVTSGLNYTGWQTVSLGSATLPALAAGAVADISVTATLPATLPATLHGRMEIIVDDEARIGELDEANNTKYADFFVTNGADLTVSAITVSSPAVPGGTISVSTTACNNGGGATGSFTTYVKLFRDAATAIVIGPAVVQSLAANACATSTYAPVTIPADLVPGNYSLIAHTDASSWVPESNEDNNVRTSAIRITGVPDLVISSITPPATAAAGSAINIPVQIRNLGTDSTGQGFNVTAYFLEYVTGRTIPLGSVSLPTLAAGGIVDATISASLPADVTASNLHRILVVVDEANQIAELNENNNSLQTDSLTMSVTTGADLTISIFTAPSRAAAGDAVSVSSTVCNIGSGKTGVFYSVVYMPGVASYLGYTVHWGGLAGNTCVTTPYQITMPANLAPGVHYFIADVDNYGGNWVPETNEGNNTRTVAVSVGPDLVVTAVSTSASKLTIGGASVTRTIGINQGSSATTITSSFGVYLSKDAAITTGDTLIGSWQLPSPPSIPAGVSFEGNNNVSIPSTMTAGTYYLGAIADIYSEQPESDESNNAFTGNLIEVIAAPTVTTNPATSLTEKCATLYGTINPNNDTSTARFEWGTTTAYGTLTANQSVPSGTAAITFTQQVCGLTPNTTYHFRAIGTNAAGTINGANQTFATYATSPPTTPTNLTAVPGLAKIDLSWTASTDNVGAASYDIERCTGSKCTNFAALASVTGTTYSNTGLAAGTYNYRVRARDVDGNLSVGYSNTAKATPTADTQAPGVPTNLAAVAVGMTQINLSWTASTDNVGVTGYKIERCLTSSCTYAEIATVAGNITTYSNTGLAADTSYTYRIRATDAAALSSAYSTSASVRTLADTESPSATTGLGATPISGAQINLAWAAATDNVAVTGYKIERCTGSNCTNFAQIAISATTSYNNTGLTGSTTYCYQVQAFDAAGNNGAYSNTSCVTTPVLDTVVPSTPTLQSATAVSNSQVNLAWAVSTDNVGVVGYKIERCTGSTCTNFVQVATSTTNSFNNNGLAARTTYRYRVRAYDAANNISAYSNIASATTPR